DIPPIVIAEERIANAKAAMPLMPDDYRDILSKAGIDAKTVEDIIAVPEIAQQVQRVYEAGNAAHAKRATFLLLQGQADAGDEAQQNKAAVPDKQLIKLSQLGEEGKLNSTAAKEVLAALQQQAGDAEEVAQRLNLIQVSDEGEI